MSKFHPTPVITAPVAVIHPRDVVSTAWIVGIKPAMTARDVSGGF